MITISLSVLIVSAGILFFNNVNNIMSYWTKGVRIMAYLKKDTPRQSALDLIDDIRSIKGVASVEYIPRETGLEYLKDQMKRQSSLFENLKDNPLPDAIEIGIDDALRNREQFERVAGKVETFAIVDQVEYGQKWLDRFSGIMDLFRLAGYVMGCLLFMAAVFFVENTIRLVLYSRREEIEILKLVGATDGFINFPFYIQGIIQGLMGGVCGIGALYAAFRVVLSNVEQGVVTGLITLQFLSPKTMAQIVAAATMIGLLGCYFSLKQFLKSYI